jgi:hypothetical protein
MKTYVHLCSRQILQNDKYFRQNLQRKSKYALCSIFFENRAVYEIMPKNNRNLPCERDGWV